MKALEEQIKDLEARRDAEIAPINQALRETMERYYDCQDDYSFGGLGDKVRHERISQIKRCYDLLIEQLRNGGFIERETSVLCLTDLEGNFLTDTLIYGRYGQCFVIDTVAGTTFVGMAKKESTFEKKGYKVVTRYRNFKVVFTGRFSDKGNPIYSSVELIGERFEDGMANNYNTHSYLDWLYQNRKEEV